jgi:hypothetical protein
MAADACTFVADEVTIERAKLESRALYVIAGVRAVGDDLREFRELRRLMSVHGTESLI